MVEFVLVLPVMAILLAGLLDLGRAYFAHVAVTDAAAEGAAFAALLVHKDEELHDIVCLPEDVEGEDPVCRAAREATHGLIRLDDAEIFVECPSCPDPTAGDPVTVTVVYPFTLVTPIVEAMVPGGMLNLRAVATQAIIPYEPH